MVDAWLQQQEEELAEDANTRVPLQVGRQLNFIAAQQHFPQLPVLPSLALFVLHSLPVH